MSVLERERERDRQTDTQIDCALMWWCALTKQVEEKGRYFIQRENESNRDRFI